LAASVNCKAPPQNQGELVRPQPRPAAYLKISGKEIKSTGGGFASFENGTIKKERPNEMAGFSSVVET